MTENEMNIADRVDEKPAAETPANLSFPEIMADTKILAPAAGNADKISALVGNLSLSDNDQVLDASNANKYSPQPLAEPWVPNPRHDNPPYPYGPRQGHDRNPYDQN